MMKLVYNAGQYRQSSIKLPASKSISNRLSIIQALAGERLDISNWSEARDSQLMRDLLKSKETELNVEMAGTVIRFLTAYFAIQPEKKIILKGAARMHQRPIAPLIEALIELGADIQYVNEPGFPPLKINGKPLKGSKIKLDASQSSQFVTAILLIAPYLKNGLDLELMNPTSTPYISMTTKLMKMCGSKIQQKGHLIRVEEGSYALSSSYEIESDWSSAAFFYQYFALSDLNELKIAGLKENSLQGDNKAAEYFKMLDVQTDFTSSGLILKKNSVEKNALNLNMSDQPDLILPYVLTAVFLRPSVCISGIHSLRIKESDRVSALLTELQKLAEIDYQVDESTIFIKMLNKKQPNATLSCHNDHRMAMSLAPLCLLFNELTLDDGKVVNKSFPNFWSEISKLAVIELKT